MIALCLPLLFAAPSPLQDPGVDRDRRIRALEEKLAEQERLHEEDRRQLEALRRELDALRGGTTGTIESEARALAPSAVGPPPGAWGRPAPGPQVTWGGYATIQYRDLGGEKSTFDSVRIVPQMSVEIAESIDFAMEIEFEGGGADASFLSDNEILVEYAELRFHVDPAFVPKAGVLLIPFNRFNLLHDDPLNELNDRPFVARRVIPSAFGQPGVGVEGAAVPFEGLGVNYDVVLSNGFDEGFTTNGGSRDARQSFREDNNDNKTVFARLGLLPDLPFCDAADFGVSGTIGKYDDEGDRRVSGWGVDGMLRWGPLEAQGEWAALSLEREDSDGPPALDLNGNGILGDVPGESDAPRGLHGIYAQLAWRFFPEGWRGCSLFTDESTFALVARYDSNDLNDRAVGATPRDDRDAWTAGFNFRPVSKTAIKFSYQRIRTPFDGPDDEGNRFVAGISTYF